MTKELVEEALRWANGHPNRRSSELMRALADALEAATEGDYHEGLEEGIKIGRAERDAALAAIERVRVVAFGHGKGAEDLPVDRDALKAALDGAPEPEEKP